MNSTRILIIAHAPLAHALRECALHVFPDCGDSVVALDIPPHAQPEESLAQARAVLDRWGGGATLVLTDVFGATPHNIAQELAKRSDTKLVAGVNLPMLLRAVCYRNEDLTSLAARAVAGGTQGIMQVTNTTPQNQNTRHHDKEHSHHQQ